MVRRMALSASTAVVNTFTRDLRNGLANDLANESNLRSREHIPKKCSCFARVATHVAMYTSEFEIMVQFIHRDRCHLCKRLTETPWRRHDGSYA